MVRPLELEISPSAPDGLWVTQRWLRMSPRVSPLGAKDSRVDSAGRLRGYAAV
jgi:hypothetical protein